MSAVQSISEKLIESGEENTLVLQMAQDSAINIYSDRNPNIRDDFDAYIGTLEEAGHGSAEGIFMYGGNILIHGEVDGQTKHVYVNATKGLITRDSKIKAEKLICFQSSYGIKIENGVQLYLIVTEGGIETKYRSTIIQDLEVNELNFSLTPGSQSAHLVFNTVTGQHFDLSVVPEGL